MRACYTIPVVTSSNKSSYFCLYECGHSEVVTIPAGARLINNVLCSECVLAARENIEKIAREEESDVV